MNPRGARPEALEWQIFRGADAVRRGLLTIHQLRGRAWQRLCHDVYADSRLERDHRLRCRAIALRLPPSATFAGPSAASLHGIAHAARVNDPVHVIVPSTARIGTQRGLRVHTIDLDPRDVVNRGGLPVTSAARTAWDLAAWLDLDVAVAVVDGLIGYGLVGPPELARQLVRGTQRPTPGSRRARRVFGLADGRAQSPPESRLRVRLIQAGLPRPVPRHPITLPSGMVTRPDLAWPELCVAVEYEAPWSTGWTTATRSPGPDEQQDRRRLNQLTAAGWAVLHVTDQRLHNDLSGIVREVRQTLTSRGWPDRRVA